MFLTYGFLATTVIACVLLAIALRQLQFVKWEKLFLTQQLHEASRELRWAKADKDILIQPWKNRAEKMSEEVARLREELHLLRNQ